MMTYLNSQTREVLLMNIKNEIEFFKNALLKIFAHSSNSSDADLSLYMNIIKFVKYLESLEIDELVDDGSDLFKDVTYASRMLHSLYDITVKEYEQN